MHRVSDLPVLIVSGSVPPEACGVGDYSARLHDLLVEHGRETSLVKLNCTSFFRVLVASRGRIVHIQYPSVGYGMSLLPILLCLLVRRPVVTLHEYTQVHILRKLAELPFLLFAARVIVTTDFEKKALPLIDKKKVSVIPVPSAFSPVAVGRSIEERNGVAFFGLMRPKKGVEEFLSLVSLLKASYPEFPVRAYSSVPVGSEEYAESILGKARELGIEWNLNRPFAEVSAGLLASRYAYLHFPDGVSDRRSSFVAAITHGLIVLTSRQETTPPALEAGVVCAANPAEAFTRISEMEKDHALLVNRQAQAETLCQRYDSGRFVRLHFATYDSLN